MRIPFSCLRWAFLLASLAVAEARQLTVHPEEGADSTAGLERGVVKTINYALKAAQPGDTVNLLPRVYFESADFINTKGEPDRPITLEGNGATLDGSAPLVESQWHEVSPGLFRCDNLLPVNDPLLLRWYFLFDGRMQRMSRSCKGPRQPFKLPAALQPGEWTYEAPPTDAVPTSRKRATGAFYLRLAPGQTLAAANISAPVRANGVSFGGACEHLVVRNVHARHVWNDGFNVHGHARHLSFQNIRATQCGDDGFSAHEDCECRIENFVSIGNGTGLCDVGQSRTHYRKVYISEAVGIDLCFLQNGEHSVREATIRSQAAKSIVLSGEAQAPTPNQVELEDVTIVREGEPNTVSVSPGSKVILRYCNFENLALEARGGEVDISHCAFQAGAKGAPIAHQIWQAVNWTAQRNWYQAESLRWGPTTYDGATFAAYQQASGQDADSLMSSPTGEIPPRPQDFGARVPATPWAQPLWP